MNTMTDMASHRPSFRVSTGMLRGGRSISALAILFLTFDGVMKLMQMAPAVEATVHLGYSGSLVFGLGLLELACLTVYAIPQTSVLGAILMTGYLGGAVATHVRIGGEPFSLLFPVLIGLLIWGGLFLRDDRLRALINHNNRRIPHEHAEHECCSIPTAGTGH
jgi:hypothetical protein